MGRSTIAVAASAAVVLALAGCSSPSGNNDKGAGTGADAGKIDVQQQTIDPNPPIPAPAVQGAQKGGIITAYGVTAPTTFDPTDTYYADSGAIAKMVFRTPTQFLTRGGRPVLVPDLTDTGTVSADKLTWTFKMRQGIKYEDGTTVKVEDLAYAIKRSFAHDVYAAGPTYQLQYFKDGGTYKGPYKSGNDFGGVATEGADTLIIHLAKPFSDLPFFMTFPLFTPIPQAKDTKQDYKQHPLATGSYMFDSYTAGSELKLKRNPYWDPATDAVRHQYPDGWDFKWGGDRVKDQQQVLSSNGPDADAFSMSSVDSTLIPQLTGNKKSQLVQGQSACTFVIQLDSRRIPLPVRKAIAKAYPYDQIYKAAGNNDYVAERASTVLPPSVPGYTKYAPLPDLDGTGPGDPAAAKQMLQQAGQTGFKLSWYYDNTQTTAQQVNQIQTDALTAAGFKVKAIGVASADIRAKTADYDAPVNMGQSPAGWCSDWPTGGSWFPVLFQSHSITDGTTWGMLSDKALDAEIDAVADLPTAQSTPKWGALDQKIMGMYVALPTYYNKMALVEGTGLGGTIGDPSSGFPAMVNMYVKK
jgi:peptide/nickel transport system substrate-binding protein